MTCTINNLVPASSAIDRARVKAAIPYNRTVRFLSLLNLYHEKNLKAITPIIMLADMELIAKNIITTPVMIGILILVINGVSVSIFSKASDNYLLKSGT